MLWVLCVLPVLLHFANVAADDPPQITLRPRDQHVRAGGIAIFYCAASGVPSPVVQWRKNGKRVSSTQIRYLVQDFPQGGMLLRIEPVRVDRDRGTYECVAENGVGDAVSADAVLTVYEADKLPRGFPQITQGPGTKVVESGRNAALHCTAVGNPAPRISWVRDMLPVDTAGNQGYTIMDSGALQIFASEKGDEGKYECIAENIFGMEYSAPTKLYVEFPRVPPQFSIPPAPTYEVTLGDNLNLTCVAVGSPMPLVKWRRGQACDLTPDDKAPVGRNVIELENIQESANYTCIASSASGSIEAITTVKVQSPSKAPSNVRVSEIMATSVRLSWSFAVPEDFQYFVIQYKPKCANQAFSEISGIITMYYTVQSLSPYTEYEFFIIAANNMGRGPPSAPVVVTTGESKPCSAPRNVQVRPLSSSTIVIQWEEPETPNGQVTGYKVYYTLQPDLPMESWESQMVVNNDLTTISDLKAHVMYTIRVQAFTSVGPSPLSLPVVAKTQQGIPSQPGNFQATSVGQETITFSWTRPVHCSEKIVSYELYWNDTYAEEVGKRRIADPLAENYTLSGLYPNTLYYVWLAARSRRGEGATMAPIAVRTKQHAPGALPQNITPDASPLPFFISWSMLIIFVCSLCILMCCNIFLPLCQIV